MLQRILKEVGKNIQKDMGLNKLAQHKIQWQALMTIVMNI